MRLTSSESTSGGLIALLLLPPVRLLDRLHFVQEVTAFLESVSASEALLTEKYCSERRTEENERIENERMENEMMENERMENERMENKRVGENTFVGLKYLVN